MIRARNIVKSFGDEEVLSNISLSVSPSSFVAIVGPSGSGKTTLLNILAKLDAPDKGEIHFELSRESKGLIGYMMQDALLLPWRTLEENALLGSEVFHGRNSSACKLLNNYFASFDLGGQKHRYPGTSSGGMKQRVALIRTLLLNPPLLLLDEPFSNLDFDIKLNIQRHLIDYQDRNGTTIILVTHDIEDAIALSHKVIVFSEKPTTIKAEVTIDLGMEKRDPVGARKSTSFREYFIRIWDELKYLDGGNSD